MANYFGQNINTTGPTTFFHYTTRDRAIAIMQDGVIRQSTGSGGDARFGIGTYLTRLGPKRSPGEIARNNWDGLSGSNWEYMVDSGRTDAVIAIEMPAHEASKVRRLDDQRDIHLYPGDLILYDKNKRFYFRDLNGKAQEFIR